MNLGENIRKEFNAQILKERNKIKIIFSKSKEETSLMEISIENKRYSNNE